MYYKLLLVCVIVITIAVKSSSSFKNDNLIAVVQIFRHGQRTPFSFYPTDPYGNLKKYWGGLPLAELTNEGKREHFHLGQFTRKRYSGWLPTAYSRDIIYVQTTDVDRTHMSAQANLYGLFPAKGSQEWRRFTDWQPIPIHPSDPKVLYVFTYTCPAYNALVDNIDNEEEYVALDSTYANMYEYISNYTKMNISSTSQILVVYDDLYIEEEVGLSLPSWTKDVYPEPIATVAAKAYERWTYTTQMKRFFTGVLLNSILTYFDEMATNSNYSQKYQMFSAHDTNIFAILNSVGQRPTKPVPFSTSLWFELRKVKSINVINLWMKSGKDFTQLSISGCALDCPLSTVRTLLGDILLDEDTFVAECAA